MVDLNRLTVVNLKKLAKECNVVLKNGKKQELIIQINNAKINPTLLENLFNKYLKPATKAKRATTNISTTGTKTLQITQLDDRIKLLEDQVKYILNKLNDMESNISKKAAKRLAVNDIQINDLKYKIKNMIDSGDTITIDDIIKTKQLRNAPFDSVEQAIVELIDDEIFDGAEGNSKHKIDGYIGRLIKR
ncbi:MAG: hypothetical protein ACFFAS_07350 [Promethearchaeota archaeon]